MAAIPPENIKTAASSVIGRVTGKCRHSNDDVSIDLPVNDWVESLREEKHVIPRDQKPKIQKVPKRRRDVEKSTMTYENTNNSYINSCYDPLVVSIGPIHHGKPDLQSMEKFKRLFTQKYAEACLNDRGIHIYQLYGSVEKEAKSARSCYADGLTEHYDDEEFARMMFVDGCFVLQYIYYKVNGNKEGDDRMEPKMKSDDTAFVQGDLFKLENQLPFRVLEALMTCRFNEDDGIIMINKFIKQLRPDPTPPQDECCNVNRIIASLVKLVMIKSHLSAKWVAPTSAANNTHHRQPREARSLAQTSVANDTRHKQPSASSPPAHLLELLRIRLLNPKATKTSSDVSLSCKGCFPAPDILNCLKKPLTKCCKGACSSCCSSEDVEGEWRTYRSVTELKKSGIHVSHETERNFSDIRLESSSLWCHNANLILPPMTIDDLSKSLFLNLVAYEACPDTPNDFSISSFLCFMDSLIDNIDDVKELRSKGVLYNMLGSDHDVAELFNQISKDLVPNSGAYCDVTRKIEKHYKDKGKVWATEWKNTHFSSPWTVLAFFAAIFVISLNVFQTILTYIQTFIKK